AVPRSPLPENDVPGLVALDVEQAVTPPEVPIEDGGEYDRGHADESGRDGCEQEERAARSVEHELHAEKQCGQGQAERREEPPDAGCASLHDRTSIGCAGFLAAWQTMHEILPEISPGCTLGDVWISRASQRAESAWHFRQSPLGYFCRI